MKRLFMITALFLFCSCSQAQTGVLGLVRSTAPLNLTAARVVLDGNSYGVGFGTRLLSYAPFSTNGTTMVNVAVNGQWTTQMIADMATQVYPLFQSGVQNILVFQEGSNDVANELSATDALANTKQYCQNIRAYAAANGIEVVIVVHTLIHRDQEDIVPNFNTLIDSYNTLLLADTSGGWDIVLQPHLDPLFATYASGGYDTDRVHPNETGQAWYADALRDALLAYRE
jgi:lysophospholipase L1-like esterase